MDRRHRRKVNYNEKSIWSKAVVLSSEEDYEDEEEGEESRARKKGTRSRRKSSKTKTAARPIETLKDDELRPKEKNQNLIKRLYRFPWRKWSSLRVMLLRTWCIFLCHSHSFTLTHTHSHSLTRISNRYDKPQEPD